MTSGAADATAARRAVAGPRVDEIRMFTIDQARMLPIIAESLPGRSARGKQTRHNEFVYLVIVFISLCASPCPVTLSSDIFSCFFFCYCLHDT